jgi:hypothetical protein
MLYDPNLPCRFEDCDFDDDNIDLRGLDEKIAEDNEADKRGETDMGFDAAGLASANHGMDEDY